MTLTSVRAFDLLGFDVEEEEVVVRVVVGSLVVEVVVIEEAVGALSTISFFLCSGVVCETEFESVEEEDGDDETVGDNS